MVAGPGVERGKRLYSVLIDLKSCACVPEGLVCTDVIGTGCVLGGKTTLAASANGYNFTDEVMRHRKENTNFNSD
jgi:hypothetical protein